MSIEPWDQQAQLQILVEAGFAEVDEQVTATHRKLAEHAAARFIYRGIDGLKLAGRRAGCIAKHHRWHGHARA